MFPHISYYGPVNFSEGVILCYYIYAKYIVVF